MKHLILLLAVVTFSPWSQAESLRKNTKSVLCDKIVMSVLVYSGDDAIQGRSICKEVIQTEVTQKIVQNWGQAEILTALDVKFSLDITVNQNISSLQGSARLLYEMTTLDSGKLKGKWLISDKHLVVDSHELSYQTKIAEYIAAVRDGDFKELLAAGHLKEVSSQDFAKSHEGFDIWDLIDNYVEPYDLPDYEIQNFEEKYYLYVKDGLAMPYAIDSKWEMRSTEFDDDEFYGEETLWLLDDYSDFIKSLWD